MENRKLTYLFSSLPCLDPAISDDDDDISIDDPFVDQIYSEQKHLTVFVFFRKNLEAFDKETRNDNIDISDVDASADLFGKK